MKKILAFLVIALICTGVAVAQDTDFPTGKWTDNNYNGVWEFGLGKVIRLYKTNGELIYDFTQDKIRDYKILPSSEGVVLSFTCDETKRSYQFIKPVKLSADLTLKIDADWLSSQYVTTIKYNKISR